MTSEKDTEFLVIEGGFSSAFVNDKLFFGSGWLFASSAFVNEAEFLGNEWDFKLFDFHLINGKFGREFLGNEWDFP